MLDSASQVPLPSCHHCHLHIHPVTPAFDWQAQLCWQLCLLVSLLHHVHTTRHCVHLPRHLQPALAVADLLSAAHCACQALLHSLDHLTEGMALQPQAAQQQRQPWALRAIEAACAPPWGVAPAALRRHWAAPRHRLFHALLLHPLPHAFAQPEGAPSQHPPRLASLAACRAPAGRAHQGTPAPLRLVACFCLLNAAVEVACRACELGWSMIALPGQIQHIMLSWHLAIALAGTCMHKAGCAACAQAWTSCGGRGTHLSSSVSMCLETAPPLPPCWLPAPRAASCQQRCHLQGARRAAPCCAPARPRSKICWICLLQRIIPSPSNVLQGAHTHTACGTSCWPEACEFGSCRHTFADPLLYLPLADLAVSRTACSCARVQDRFKLNGAPACTSKLCLRTKHTENRRDGSLVDLLELFVLRWEHFCGASASNGCTVICLGIRCHSHQVHFPAHR